MTLSAKNDSETVAVHREMISALGSRRAVAETISVLLGETVKLAAVNMWAHRGIPWKFRPLMAEICKHRGITVPAGFLGLGGAR